MSSSAVVDMSATGRRISDWRVRIGLSVQELCERIFVTPQAYGKWVAGKCLPSIDSLVLLSEVYECRIDDIIVRTSDAGGPGSDHKQAEGGADPSSPGRNILVQLYGFLRSMFMRR